MTIVERSTSLAYSEAALSVIAPNSWNALPYEINLETIQDSQIQEKIDYIQLVKPVWSSKLELQINNILVAFYYSFVI